jgi:hypothetical protein
MSVRVQQNTLVFSVFLTTIISDLLRSFTFMRDPTGTPTGPEEQRRTGDSVICDQPAMPMRCRQCSESTPVFGGIADMAGLAIAATRSRMTPKQTLRVLSSVDLEIREGNDLITARPSAGSPISGAWSTRTGTPLLAITGAPKKACPRCHRSRGCMPRVGVEVHTVYAGSRPATR